VSGGAARRHQPWLPAGGDARLVDAVKNRDLVNMRSLLKQRIDRKCSDAEA